MYLFFVCYENQFYLNIGYLGIFWEYIVHTKKVAGKDLVVAGTHGSRYIYIYTQKNAFVGSTYILLKIYIDSLFASHQRMPKGLGM